MSLPKEGRKFYENLMLLLLSNGWDLRVFVLCVCVFFQKFFIFNIFIGV